MMANALQASLYEVQKAYFIGSQKKPVPLTADPFQPQLLAVLEKRLPEEQLALIEQAQVFCNQGLDLARQGELVAATGAFQQAETFLATRQFSKEARLLSQSLYEAAVAYLDYRNAAPERALGRLHTALALDLTLEEIPGYALIQGHRIRLLLNMLRIQMKYAPEEAMRTGIQVMDYLERKADMTPLSAWKASNLADIPQVLKELLFTEAMGGIATLLTGVDTTKTAQMADTWFAGLASHIHSPEADGCSLSPQAHAWLRAKQALRDGQAESFLRQAIPLLSQGRTSLPQLWYATIIDLHCLCQRLELPEAKMLSKEIIAAAPSWPWKHFPQNWQVQLHLTSEQPGAAHLPETRRSEYGPGKQKSAPLAVLSKSI